MSDGAPAAAAPWRVVCCPQRGAAAAHARRSSGKRDFTHLLRSAATTDDTVLGLVLAVSFCVGCASASAGGLQGGERLWKQVGKGGLDTGPRPLATRGKSSFAIEASRQFGFVPSRALHRATGASSSRVPPLGARMPQAGSSSRHLRSPPLACRALRRSLLHMVRGGDEGAPISTVSVYSGARSRLWGNWTEHQVKIATLLWIEKFVIGLKLCPFAVEAMNGLRVHVADATNRDMALDQVDVEIKWIVGLDKALPACTLMVYPPALFEKSPGDAPKTSPLCDLDENSRENCEGFDGFMSLALDAREMAQGFNAAHGQDVDTETLFLPLPCPSHSAPCVCMCACVCVCVCECVCVCVCVYTCIYTHALTHALSRTRLHTHTHAYIHLRRLLTFHPNSTFSDVIDDPAGSRCS